MQDPKPFAGAARPPRRRRRLPVAAHAFTWLVGLAVLVSQQTEGSTGCTPAGLGVERCVAGLSAREMSRIAERQEMSNWCWAASVSMLLRRYGLDVPQADIVRTYYQDTPNKPLSEDGIRRLVSQSWRDRSGSTSSLSAMWMPARRELGVRDPAVLRDLQEGRPVLIGAAQHAMLLVQVVYERRPGDPESVTGYVRAVVLDPEHPAAVRSLRSEEWMPQMILRVRALDGSDA